MLRFGFGTIVSVCLLTSLPAAAQPGGEAAPGPEPPADPSPTPPTGTAPLDSAASTPEAAEIEEPTGSPAATPVTAASPFPPLDGSAPTPSEGDAPGAEPQNASTPASAGYDKGFFIRSVDDPYSLNINLMLQTRFTWEGVDGGPDEAQLALKRARLKLTGTAFDDDLGYFFQAEFGSGEVKLMDFFLDYGIVPGKLHVRVGQWRRPFSREFITAVTKLDLVDRSPVDKAFRADRDIGVALHNRYEKSPPFEWVVGAFNGTGAGSRFSGDVVVDPDTMEGEVTSGRFSNVPSHLHPMFVARVGYNHGGLVGYSQGDLEGGAPRFGIGLAGMIDADADGGDDSFARSTADATVKAYGFSATAAGYVSSEQTGTAFGDRGLEAVGFVLGGGYVIAERFQPVARWAVVFPEDGSDREEILGGLSVYFQKHRLKWQSDVGVVAEELPGENEITPVFRSQLQAVF